MTQTNQQTKPLNTNLQGSLATVAGETELAELEAYLDQNKADDADPQGKLDIVRETTRKLGRVIVENTSASEERRNALNDLKRVYTNAKIAVYR